MTIDDCRLTTPACGANIHGLGIDWEKGRPGPRERAMTPEQMRERTMAYALRVVKLVRSLPNDVACHVIGRQLLRAGTSVAANYRAACRGRSRSEFVAKMGIVEEEADESLFWMEMLHRSNIIPYPRLSDLMKDGNELVAITVSSKRTARAAAKGRGKSSIDNRQPTIT